MNYHAHRGPTRCPRFKPEEIVETQANTNPGDCHNYTASEPELHPRGKRRKRKTEFEKATNAATIHDKFLNQRRAVP